MNEENNLKNQIEEYKISLNDNNLSKISSESSKLISHYLYQNDYYFIDELKDTDYQYQYKNIKQLLNLNKSKNKPPIFTVITPTMGSTNLSRLKQILKQESVSYIHLILWDKNRRKSRRWKFIS